jgi:hypothetical protein
LGPLVLCKNVNNNSEMPSVFVPNSQWAPHIFLYTEAHQQMSLYR